MGRRRNSRNKDICHGCGKIRIWNEGYNWEDKEEIYSVGIWEKDVFNQHYYDSSEYDSSDFDDFDGVNISTVHSSKGLEFPVVFVAGCEQGLVPFAKDGENIDNLEEERRLFYVAMTRAMDILCLTYAKKRTIYGKSFKRQRSFFIDDIEKRLTQVEKSPVFLSINKKEKQLELF